MTVNNNICTIFEINAADDGQLYLVMAHYEGETLKERIARGPLALDDAVDIATQIGQGLAEVSQHDNLARSGGWQVGTVLRAFLAGFKEANRWQNNTARSTGGCS